MALPPNRTPQAPGVAAAAAAAAGSGGSTTLGHFLGTHPAARALLPPQTRPEAVRELLARFAANNFGVLDDLQVWRTVAAVRVELFANE